MSNFTEEEISNFFRTKDNIEQQLEILAHIVAFGTPIGDSKWSLAPEPYEENGNVLMVFLCAPAACGCCEDDTMCTSIPKEWLWAEDREKQALKTYQHRIRVEEEKKKARTVKRRVKTEVQERKQLAKLLKKYPEGDWHAQIK